MPAPFAPRTTTPSASRILHHFWRGTFLLAVKLALQVVVGLWTIPLVQGAIGAEANGGYVFAWGFGFVQFLLEFGMSSALLREMTLAWTRNDREKVNRLIGCGMTFYGAVALVQFAILIGIAYAGVPAHFEGETRRLIVQLLWLQALSGPFFGLLTVVSSVLQAARRYEFLPLMEIVVTVVRLLVLVVGLHIGVPFIEIVALQLIIQLIVMLAPSLWVMGRELGLYLHFSHARLADFSALARVGFYTFLMQLSVAFADRIDTTVLGYALPAGHAGHGITVYQNVSKPFLQIRQIGWTLAYLVMPAVASLAAAGDRTGLDRLKYDGSRILVGILTPVVLLAWIFAVPFLGAWVGAQYTPYAPWLRLFLVATLPLALSIHAQMAIGLGRLKVVALSPFLGSLVNLPLSYYLTTRIGVPGVIWGTVLTTLISNLLIPGAYLFHVLEIRPAIFLNRTLLAPLAGAAGLILAANLCLALSGTGVSGTSGRADSLRLLLLLAASSFGYLVGYLVVPVGRRDVRALLDSRTRKRQSTDTTLQ